MSRLVSGDGLIHHSGKASFALGNCKLNDIELLFTPERSEGSLASWLLITSERGEGSPGSWLLITAYCFIIGE